MRLVTFIANNAARLGVLIDGELLDLPGAHAAWQQANLRSPVRVSDQQSFPTSVVALLQAGEATRAVVDHVLAFAADPAKSSAWGTTTAATSRKWAAPCPSTRCSSPSSPRR